MRPFKFEQHLKPVFFEWPRRSMGICDQNNIPLRNLPRPSCYCPLTKSCCQVVPTALSTIHHSNMKQESSDASPSVQAERPSLDTWDSGCLLVHRLVNGHLEHPVKLRPRCQHHSTVPYESEAGYCNEYQIDERGLPDAKTATTLSHIRDHRRLGIWSLTVETGHQH